MSVFAQWCFNYKILYVILSEKNIISRTIHAISKVTVAGIKEVLLFVIYHCLRRSRGILKRVDRTFPDRKLTVPAIEGKTRSAVMLYREGSLFRLRKWHIDGSWPPVGSSDRLPRVASYRMIGPPLPYNVHAVVYTVFRNIRRPSSGCNCSFGMSCVERVNLRGRDFVYVYTRYIGNYVYDIFYGIAFD